MTLGEASHSGCTIRDLDSNAQSTSLYFAYFTFIAHIYHGQGRNATTDRVMNELGLYIQGMFLHRGSAGR